MKENRGPSVSERRRGQSDGRAGNTIVTLAWKRVEESVSGVEARGG